MMEEFKKQKPLSIGEQNLHPNITNERILHGVKLPIPFKKENPFSVGEYDLYPNITNERKLNGGMLMDSSTFKKASVKFYPIFPKFDNDELLPPKWETFPL